MNERSVVVSQDRNSPVTFVEGDGFAYRYAYRPSPESLVNGDRGQDYLEVRQGGRRLAFALCDGVGGSFAGDLAARLAGSAIVEWFWGHCPKSSDLAEISRTLEVYLNHLVGKASLSVDKHPIPEGKPAIVRDVLVEKRAHGSETTFVAGMLDLDLDRVIVAWIGDSRLRVWAEEEEVTPALGATFRTKDRWSTRAGLIGHVNAHEFRVGEISRLIAYSDGLASIDTASLVDVSNNALEDRVTWQSDRADSDDISYLEIWIDRVPALNRLVLSAPVDIRADPGQDGARIKWSAIPGATQYEVEVRGVAPGTTGGERRGAMRVRTSGAGHHSRWSGWHTLGLGLPAEKRTTPVGAAVGGRAKARRFSSIAFLVAVLFAAVEMVILVLLDTPLRRLVVPESTFTAIGTPERSPVSTLTNSVSLWREATSSALALSGTEVPPAVNPSPTSGMTPASGAEGDDRPAATPPFIPTTPTQSLSSPTEKPSLRHELQ